MKLIYYVSKYLGLVGFEWNQNSPSSGRTIVSVNCIIVHFLLITVLTSMDLLHFENETSFISEIFVLISKAISHMILVILCFYNKRNICRIMKNLMHSSQLLENGYFYIRIAVVIVHLCLGITAIILSHIIAWFYMERYLNFIPRYVLYIFTDLSLYVIELQFINCVLSLKQCFADINSRMQTVKFTRNSMELSTVYAAGTLRTLEYFHLFHDSLCDIARLVNTVYSPVVLLDIGLSFIRSTQKLYRIVFSNLIREPGIPFFYSFIYKCFQWMKFLFLICACSSCSQEVSGTH